MQLTGAPAVFPARSVCNSRCRSALRCWVSGAVVHDASAAPTRSRLSPRISRARTGVRDEFAEGAAANGDSAVEVLDLGDVPAAKRRACPSRDQGIAEPNLRAAGAKLADVHLSGTAFERHRLIVDDDHLALGRKQRE